MKNKSNYKAILAYLSFIGLIIAYILNMEEKDKLVSYHIKNMFGLVILLFISTTFIKGNSFLFFSGQVIWVACFFFLDILSSYGNYRETKRNPHYY